MEGWSKYLPWSRGSIWHHKSSCKWPFGRGSRKTWINGILKQPQAVETLLWCTVNQRANLLVFELQMLTLIRCSIGSIKSNYFLYKPASLEWSWTMVAVSWEHGGSALGVCCECTGYVLGVYWGYARSLLGTAVTDLSLIPIFWI